MPDCAKVPPHLPEQRPALDLSLAFPAALRPAVAALTALPAWDPGHNVGAFDVMLNDELLSIPSRVYFFQSVLWDIGGERTPLERDIAWCLGTRHHSGRVREQCLRRMLAAPQPWMAPFIVQLIGEYVVEIVEPIATALPTFAPEMQAALAAFVRDNPRYLNTIDSRTVSYWMCYYLRQYPQRASYPGAVAVAYLRALAQQAAG
jgi:hypothetical protein